jgi:hypothetical protein
MANQIIILGSSTSNGMLSLQLVFWFPISSGQKVAAGVSAWPNASVAENTAIQNGSILEEQGGFSFPVGLPAANIEAYLLQYWTNRNAQIGGVGPGQYQNFGYNGSAWVANIS